MTHLLILPGNDNMFLLETDSPAEDLLWAVNEGDRQLPPPLDTLLPHLIKGEENPSLVAFRQGSLVVITTGDGENSVLSPALSSIKLDPPPLSRRQQQVLDLLVTGCTLKEIAFELGIKPSTVRMHLTHIKRRLGTETLAQTVGRAAALGLC